VPGQQRFRGDDTGDFLQESAAHGLDLGCQPTALIVVQPNPPAAESFTKYPILLTQVLDGKLLLLIQPSGQ
jgi:hypothetical protein